MQSSGSSSGRKICDVNETQTKCCNPHSLKEGMEIPCGSGQ